MGRGLQSSVGLGKLKTLMLLNTRLSSNLLKGSCILGVSLDLIQALEGFKMLEEKEIMVDLKDAMLIVMVVAIASKIGNTYSTGTCGFKEYEKSGEFCDPLCKKSDYVYMEEKYEGGSNRRRCHEMLKGEKIKIALRVEESLIGIKLPQLKSKLKEVQKYMLKKKCLKKILNFDWMRFHYVVIHESFLKALENESLNSHVPFKEMKSYIMGIHGLV
ncbi:hypothetical protein M9H77_16873 [Catharanthus roseus]|uniref:Uncharacterized protein n=1 Tax=Catharanthus roseus TaxID=4058 RepID=A0ACC0B308_CATRO|nr:hypothetical protein M9H77_16873 [Catharanthus roseus]